MSHYVDLDIIERLLVTERNLARDRELRAERLGMAHLADCCHDHATALDNIVATVRGMKENEPRS